MRCANKLLSTHPYCLKSQSPANGIWLWAQGTVATLPSFSQKYAKKGFVVSAVPLIWGIGALSGYDRVLVPGATGDLDTDYEGKAEATFQGLVNGYDLSVLHVEAPDECTHMGDLSGKLQAIENIDKRCLALLQSKLALLGEDYRILLLSDHKTLTSTKGHDGDPVPYVIYDSRIQGNSGHSYSEREAQDTELIEDGYTLLERFLKE
jgi:2,3-bisphosphoglycerate-independent phosphoglycerate mutase